jgi:putative phosphoribosyl transferase
VIAPFADRHQAGLLLAERLAHLGGRPDTLVLGLPRGGVPVACAVARRLGAPLDALLVRKLGVPWQPELAMGAIASGGLHHLDHGLINTYGIEEEEIEVVIARESRRLAEQEALYRQPGRQPPVIRDRTVILVDDGVATGATMIAAALVLRSRRPAALVVAAPVAAPHARARLRRQGRVDEVVVVTEPEEFHSVATWYQDFSPVADGDVRRMIAEACAPVGAARHEGAT